MPALRALAVAVAGFSIVAITIYACTATPERRNDDDPVAACLADAGQDSSLTSLDKRRLEDAAFNSAFEACAAAIGVKVLPPGEETRKVDQVVNKFVSCLRGAGWDIPEPTRGEDGLLDTAAYDKNVPDSGYPKFQVDRRRCLETLKTSPSSHEHPGHDHHEHGHNG